MFDQYQHAKAIKRVEKKNQESVKAAYAYMLESPHGRWFLSNLMDVCKLYEPVNSLEDEGSRRVAVLMRKTIAETGLLDKLQLAEMEYCEYKKNLELMLEQTEASEAKEDL